MTEKAPLTHRDTCRLCGGAGLSRVLSLTPTPPANAFVTKDELEVEQACYPLDLFFCESCAHVQLLDVVDPRVLFENYVYVSGTSPVFVKYLGDQARSVASRFGLGTGDLALEIGSNDGTLLKAYRDGGLSVLGIDPARDIAARASASGIETWPEFFGPALADRVVRERGKAKVVAANNVFAHADDLGAIADGIRALLADDGVFVFEVSYLLDVLEKTLFDTIYHEHLSYHSVAPLKRFFEARGLHLFDAARVEAHGGSLRGFVQWAGGPHEETPAVAGLIATERAAGLDRAATFEGFATRIDALKAELTGLLVRLKADGKRIVGYGAPAKATTLMYAFELGAQVLDFIVDESPLKQGLYTPGLHLPVLAPAALDERKPDYLLILAWNFARPIMEKNARYAGSGTRFIVPSPNVEVLPS